jgi:putative ABC transport system substrate-binding protein
MQATTTIPVVFAALGDAVGSGVVATLAHPDRNATGFSFLNTEIASKRFELLREMLPQARRIAVLSYRLSTIETGEAGLDAARAFGIESPIFAVGDPDEFDSAFAQAVAARAEAMNVLAGTVGNFVRGWA